MVQPTRSEKLRAQITSWCVLFAMSSIAIIGAGLSGISAARSLQAAGHRVVVFEKSRSFGGRCAARFWEGNVVDHGAQYFTAESEQFNSVLETLPEGLIGEITAPILNEAGHVISSDSKRLYFLPGNNRLAKSLAHELTISMEKEISSITQSKDRWTVGGEEFEFVISSAPWPQTAKLLGMETKADETMYERCLTAFFRIDENPTGRASEIYGIRDSSGHPLAWTACENHKQQRITPNFTVLVVQASGDFSMEHWDTPADQWTALLKPALAKRWEIPSSKFLGHFAHRWRYSIAQRNVSPTLPDGVFLTGDSTCASRVEAAWLCGEETARELLTRKPQI